MAALPQPRSQTVEAIYAWWEGKLSRLSRRLGASQIGRECERELWYGFRWCRPASAGFNGRMRRLFDRGHREEQVFIDELRGIGCDVRATNPATGEQFEFTAVDGHVVAKIDGVALGIPEAPRTWHNLSFKTINTKGHAALLKDGVASKPEHVAQAQVEMHLAQLTRTLYLSANKDTDDLYAERIRYDEALAQRLMEKAERVVYAPEPLQKLSEDAAFWKCKGCTLATVCHGQALPPVSCRTCLHATPERGGDGRWSCAYWKQDIPNVEAQQAACPNHRFIPALLRNWGEAVDASEAEGWVQYRAADGFEFRNGPWGLGSFTSKELAASTPSLLRDPQFQALRAKVKGEIVDDREAA
jgi:hypothetical protein